MQKQEDTPITTAQAVEHTRKTLNDRFTALLHGQRLIAGQVAQQQGLPAITSAMSSWATGFLNLPCSIALYGNNATSHSLYHLASAGIQDQYHHDMPLMRVDESSCCFGIAAHTRQLTVSADITTDPHWASWHDRVMQQQLQACWSAPIISDTGQLQGVIALYFSSHRTPDTEELHLVTLAGQLAQAALLSQQQWEDTRRQEQRIRGELNEALKVAEMGSWSMDLHTLQTYYSPLIRKWFGLPADQAPMHQVLDCVHPDDRERVEVAVRKAILENGIYEVEYRVINCESKQQRTIYVQGKVLLDDNNQPYLLSGVAKNVTLQRMTSQLLEQEVENRTFELKEANLHLLNANDNLQQFVYIASHDLQEPLRKIHFFSDILLNKHTFHLDNAGQQLLGKIAYSAKRMSTLIKGLLEFSRVDNNDKAYATVNLNSVIDNIRNDYELYISRKGALFHVDKLCEVEVDPVQINQLFYNLIGNALKFSSEHRSPEIRISSRYLSEEERQQYRSLDPRRDYCELLVTDNGIGFDQQFAEQIFEIFQRLHNHETYEGSGIGLALCKKIVDNHSGNIFARSTLGKGTTFHVILPVKGLMK